MSTGLRFTLEVDGLPPDAFAVVSFHLNQSLSSLFSLDLSLVSQQFLSLEFAQVLDKMAYLTIWQGDEVQRRVKGVVTWFELGENDKNQMLYSMKVHPPLWRAGLRQNFRIFQNEDIKSILGTMLQENGVPGPLPFILSRTYSSYRTRTPAPVGVFGPGWKAPSDIRLQLRDDALVLNDNGGRSIHFEPLLPGEAVYSRSESMWLVRGGKAAQPDGHTLARLWGALPPDIRLSPHLYLATNSAQGPWWILGGSERVPGAEDVLPAPLPPYRVLTGLADRFGRTLTYRREAAGDLAGEITGVTDGAGREFRLVLTTQA
ncbi:contractile injection system protein, VgrG/Pvc8 family, partial [Escherichia coli]